MRYKFFKKIDQVKSVVEWGKDFILLRNCNEALCCFDKKDLNCIWNYIYGDKGTIYKDKVFVTNRLEQRTDVLFLFTGEVIDCIKLNFLEGISFIWKQFCWGTQLTGMLNTSDKLCRIKFDLEQEIALEMKISEYPYEFFLNESDYISMLYYDEIFRVNFDSNRVLWKYKISDLVPFLNDFNVLEPPTWDKRRSYNLYLNNNQLLVTVSKGVIALSLETGQLLWQTDLLFDPLYLSFFNGKGYCRDWERFASIDLLTGKLLLQKEYVGFKIDTEEIWTVPSYGFVIENNRGYFMLDYKGTSYILSMNLDDGNVTIETELPEIKNHVHTEDIHFEGNRLYIRDCASILYVYELLD